MCEIEQDGFRATADNMHAYGVPMRHPLLHVHRAERRP